MPTPTIAPGTMVLYTLAQGANYGAARPAVVTTSSGSLASGTVFLDPSDIGGEEMVMSAADYDATGGLGAPGTWRALL